MANSSLIQLAPAVEPALAWLFPGQGAQETGMGADLYDAFPAARRVYDAADAVLGYALSRVCFEGPDERLRDTRYSQPAILVTSLACLAAALESGCAAARPAFMAGHSIGEFTALIATGSLCFDDGVRLVQERGRLMAEAGEQNQGTMAAVLGLDEDAVAQICAEAGADVCNRNLPTQTVVGGSRDAVERVMALAKERGAARVVALNVSGAFHSRLMQPAVAGLAAFVAKLEIAPPSVPVVSNLEARPFESAAEIRDEVPRQVVRPVRWHESVAFLAANGVDRYVEFGPGRVLTGLVKRIVTNAAIANVGGAADLKAGAAA